MTDETVDDLLREMREGPVHACFVTEVGAAADANGKFRDFADRLDAAHKRDMDNLREENGRLKEALKDAIPFSCLKCTLWNSRAARCSRGSGMCEQVWKWNVILGGGAK